MVDKIEFGERLLGCCIEKIGRDKIRNKGIWKKVCDIFW
jgi:hypothetical protein